MVISLNSQSWMLKLITRTLPLFKVQKILSYHQSQTTQKMKEWNLDKKWAIKWTQIRLTWQSKDRDVWKDSKTNTKIQTNKSTLTLYKMDQTLKTPIKIIRYQLIFLILQQLRAAEFSSWFKTLIPKVRSLQSQDYRSMSWIIWIITNHQMSNFNKKRLSKKII